MQTNLTENVCLCKRLAQNGMSWWESNVRLVDCESDVLNTLYILCTGWSSWNDTNLFSTSFLRTLYTIVMIFGSSNNSSTTHVNKHVCQKASQKLHIVFSSSILLTLNFYIEKENEIAVLIIKFISRPTANCQAWSQSKTFKRMSGQKLTSAASRNVMGDARSSWSTARLCFANY